MMDARIRKKVRTDFFRWKELVTNFNRFDTEHSLLNVLIENRGAISCGIREGTRIFRGRIYSRDKILSSDDQLVKFIEEESRDFEGFNAEESGAPPKEFATEGRLNCAGISFLYTCSDPKTVVYELRPIKNEYISIAELSTNRRLRFADLRKGAFSKFRDNDLLQQLTLLIAVEFSRPHYQGHNYWFTQYLAGQFINMGFDGVVFSSSLYPEGDNLVFFYPEQCDVLNSRLYKVDKISISFDSITRKELLS